MEQLLSVENFDILISEDIMGPLTHFGRVLRFEEFLEAFGKLFDNFEFSADLVCYWVFV